MQIQDTPGYGDDLNLQANIDRVRRYITNQNEAWLRLENSASRGELAEKIDPRVDICLFCLPPHRVRNIDMLFMWEISQVRPHSCPHPCSTKPQWTDAANPASLRLVLRAQSGLRWYRGRSAVPHQPRLPRGACS